MAAMAVATVAVEAMTPRQLPLAWG